MPKLTITSFSGIAPRTPARYLQDGQAQIAVNCPVFYGSIQPLTESEDTGFNFSSSGTIQTIYRFGQDLVSDLAHWFEFTDDVDVARSQISGDTSEVTFYTGVGAPKFTYASIATASAPLPTANRPLGLPAPTNAPTTVVGGMAEEGAVSQSYTYVYTFVNQEGGFTAESAPSLASSIVDASTGETITISGFESAPAGYSITAIRIYKAINGEFLFLTEINTSTPSYEDPNAASSLNEPIPSIGWDTPPEDLAGLINLPNGMMAGFVGRDVYFCEPYRPYAWPLAYSQTVDYPVVGLGRMDTTLAVLTTGNPYIMQGASPDGIAVVKSDINQACVSKRSIVSAQGMVIYASPDGLMSLSPGGSRNLTERLFSYRQWQAFFDPETIHAYYQDNKYIAFYDNGAEQGGFIYDLSSGQFILHNQHATAGFQDVQRDKLFLAYPDKSLRVWEGTATPITYRWKSKVFSQLEEGPFSCAQLEAEQYPMTMNIYKDGALHLSKTVTSRDPFRLPAGRGRDWEIEIIGDYEVFAASLAHSMTELAVG